MPVRRRCWRLVARAAPRFPGRLHVALTRRGRWDRMRRQSLGAGRPAALDLANRAPCNPSAAGPSGTEAGSASPPDDRIGVTIVNVRTASRLCGYGTTTFVDELPRVARRRLFAGAW